MVKLLDRVKQAVSGTASSTTLGAAAEGFRTFNTAGAATNDVCRYAIEDDNGAFEIGTIVINSATTGTRTVQISSNSNNALTLTGNAVIFATLSAADLAGNAAPIWTTTPPSTLDLDNDGSTAVTLAGVAIDEFPVQYSWDGYSGTTLFSDSNLPPQLASAPTFSGGTASLVGSSTQSNAGSFNFRMKASDGVKTATAITEVTLSFYPVTSGLLGLYDVADSSSYSGSGTTWSDISGNSGPNLTLLSSTTYNSSGIGSQPSLSYGTAVDSVLTTSNLGTSVTIFAILQVTAPPTNSDFLCLFGRGGSNRSPLGIIMHDGDTSSTFNSSSGYRLTANDGSDSDTLIIDKTDVSSSSRDALADTLYLSTGAAAQMHSIALRTANLSEGFSLFPRDIGGTTSGQIRALAFYNRDLTTSEIASLHAYFKAGYPSDSHMPS